MNKIIRAVRFEVTFPGYRRVDLLGIKKGDKGKADPTTLWPRLWRAQDDLLQAANRIIAVLAAIRWGAIPQPTKADGSNIHERTLAYQGLSGKWQPYDTPLYLPSEGCEVAGSVKNQVSDRIVQRLSQDWSEHRQGKKSLPSFRRMPILFHNKLVEVLPNLDVRLRLWAGRGATPIVVRARKLDGGSKSILHALAANKEGWKRGQAQLCWVKTDSRKGKWMLVISYAAPTPDVVGDLVCGVHLGMTTTCSLAYVDNETGKQQRARDLIHIPTSVWHALARYEARRVERRKAIRGGGHGRQRVWRAETGDTRANRIAKSAVREVAARVVAAAKQRGASTLGVEDLMRWSVDRAMDDLPNATNRTRAGRRRWYLRWHQGMLRTAIQQAAEREGLIVVDVDAAYDSRTCARCGERYVHVVEEGDVIYGRWKWRRFRCRCGWNQHADRNAALNVAKRTREVLREKPKSG